MLNYTGLFTVVFVANVAALMLFYAAREWLRVIRERARRNHAERVLAQHFAEANRRRIHIVHRDHGGAA